MTIDWQQFTPWLSLGGGLLIGVAAGWFVLFNGRIAGISGIIGGLWQNLLDKDTLHLNWRLAFVAGLMLPSLGLWAWGITPTIVVEANTATLIIAGLLVGIGTRYASGCTSGHGVCGMARLSLRSIIATATFMAAGFITVYLDRHFFGG